MKSNYEDTFNREIEAILSELYHNPLNMGESKIKRVVYKTELRYVDYLEEKQLIKRLTAGDGVQNFGMQLERKGFEVFEKYDGWLDYKSKVIDKAKKTDRARAIAQRYWWIPIALSLAAVIISLIAMLKK